MKQKRFSPSDDHDEAIRASKYVKAITADDASSPLLLLADVATRSRERTIPVSIPQRTSEPNIQVTRPYPKPVLVSPTPPSLLSRSHPPEWRRPPDFITQFETPRPLIPPLIPRPLGFPRCAIHSNDLPPHIRAAMGPYSLTVMRNSGKSSGGNVLPPIQPFSRTHNQDVKHGRKKSVVTNSVLG